jgi:two-component SAPR family response regulator
MLSIRMTAPVETPLDSRCSRPAIRPTVLERPRVQDLLHSSVGNGLIVVQAPSGYAKSTELSVFVSQVDYRIAWLSLDATAQNADVFARELGKAILGSDSWAPVSVARAEDLRAYIAFTFRELAQRTDAPLMLVLDNAHELNASPDACDLLAWLVDTAPPGYEIVVAGREPLPIPSIDKRVASGEAAFIAADELAFTVDEVADLCSMRDSAVSADAAFAATAGWPIALAGVLTGTLALGNDTPARFAPGTWDRYMVSDVWEAVPGELREQLLLASIPPTLERDAALAVMSASDWDRLKRWLEQRAFFSESVGGQAIRLNPSFQRFLRTQLTSTDYDLAAEATGLIVAWLERVGRIGDAIQVSMDLDMPPVLVGTLERHADALMMQGASSLLSRAFDAIPLVYLPEESPLNALRLRVMAHVGFPEAALEQAVALLRRPISPTTRFHALLARIRCLRSLGRGAELTQLFQETRGVVDGEEPALLAEYYFMEAQNCLYVTADYDRADRLLKECHALAEQGGAMHLALLAQSARGDLLTLRGDAPQAVDELTRAASGWRRMRGAGNLCWVLNNLAVAQLQVGDTTSAIEVLREALREAEAIESARGEAFAVASLGDAYLALGDFEAAKHQYEDAIRRSADGVLDATLTVYSLIGLSIATLVLGDVAHADFLAARAIEIAVRGGNPQEVAASELQAAATLSAAGDHDGAELHASRSALLFNELGAANGVRLATYRLAMCRFRASRRPQAEEALQDLGAVITAPWMVGGLRSLIRENRMFAQWAASRSSLPAIFREEVRREAIAEAAPVEEPASEAFPRVAARSLGTVSVSVDGVPVSERQWTTVRARELFFVFLAHPGGVRKEDAVLSIFPDLPPSRCNSAFHSNLHRVRRALYRESVVVNEGVYRLNPDGEFEWDVASFLHELRQANELPAGSRERADAYEHALSWYRGPFAAEFFNEWADSVRADTERATLQALSSLAGFNAGRGEFAAAAGYLEQALALSPFNEEAAHELALCQARAGNAVVAIGSIDEFGERVDREFGQPLPARLRELRSAIATGRAV